MEPNTRPGFGNAAVLSGVGYTPSISMVCIGDCLKPFPDLSAFRANETEEGRCSFRQSFVPYGPP